MELLFNLDGDFDAVFETVFSALELSMPVQADSVNVLGGVYGKASVFGLSIRLEENSYDYEDDFRWMIRIKRNPLSRVSASDRSVAAVTEIVRDLLVLNLGIPVGIERGQQIELTLPPMNP